MIVDISFKMNSLNCAHPIEYTLFTCPCIVKIQITFMNIY